MHDLRHVHRCRPRERKRVAYGVEFVGSALRPIPAVGLETVHDHDRLDAPRFPSRQTGVWIEHPDGERDFIRGVIRSVMPDPIGPMRSIVLIERRDDIATPEQWASVGTLARAIIDDIDPTMRPRATPPHHPTA